MKMKIYETDKEIIRKLVTQKEKVKSIKPETQKDDQMHWGLSFNDLFRDINESISFSSNAGDVYVYVNDKKLHHGANMNGEAYMHYNQTMSLQVKVIHRLLLLRRLEEERLIVWMNTGERIADLENKNKFFYLINAEDKKFISENINYEAVATDELVEIVNKGFKTTEDIRFNKTIWVSWIAVAVAFGTGLASLLISINK